MVNECKKFHLPCSKLSLVHWKNRHETDEKKADAFSYYDEITVKSSLKLICSMMLIDIKRVTRENVLRKHVLLEYLTRFNKI